MKFYLKISLLISLSFTILNCSTTKKKTINKVENKLTIAINDTIKESKHNFFNETVAEKKWVDSIFTKMTFDEKLGQLFMASAYSNKDSLHTKEIDKLISEYKVGNLIFFQGGPLRQAKLTNRYQSKSKTPLFIAIDAEWGLSMRLDSTFAYPWNMTLGALKDPKLIEEVGVNIAKHTKRMGIQFNFGPVLDININPKNPIIGFRSFGEDKFKVTENAGLMMKGIQSQGIFATGKHFPGHGDTDMDSHNTLPTLNFTKERLEDIELYPYKKLFKQGLASVMVAHLNIPSLEVKNNVPSSVSYSIVTNLLKEQMGFKGLIFTDALNMKGSANFRKPGQLDLEAFLAGNDILLCPDNIPVAIQTFKQAYKDSVFDDNRLEFSVKKILKFKYLAGLNNYKPIDLNNIITDLNTNEDTALKYKIYENAITVIKNENNVLPIKDLSNSKIAYVKLGDAPATTFIETLNKYTQVTELASDNIDSLLVKLKTFNTVIIGFHKSDKIWKKHEFKEKDLLLLQKIAESHPNVILNVLANPYSLLQVQDLKNIKSIVITYQNGDIAQEVAASLIFGAIASKGSLPISIGENFKIGTSITTEKLNRLGFTAPKNVGMNPDVLSKIDVLVQKAITQKMTPSAQVLVARKGKIIFQKAYGYFDYSNTRKTKTIDVYDVASMTKILATLPISMQLFDNNKIKLDDKLSDLLPLFKNSDKKDISLKDLMSHYAKLQAWIPFYKATLDSSKKPMTKYYSKTFKENFSKKVADSLFIRNDFHDTIMKIIVDSKLIPNKEYKYSDFTFMILKDIIEKYENKKLDDLAQNNFFNIIGANNTMFNPLSRISKQDIPPTENDTYFRHQIIQGYVHDMAAAMEGGVAGHAGLFANAIDVAKIMQMYLQKGSYGGHQFFSEKTFDIFNTCHFCNEGNRRGLGFDKPQLAGQNGPTCGCVSPNSFGHTGFTGTMTWADPETEIVYVFLSNRTFSGVNSANLLLNNKIREDIQKVIQEAIIE